MSYQEIADGLITINEAKLMLGYSSRNSVEHLLKRKKLRFIWICQGRPSAIRLIYKSDVETFKEG